MQGDIIPNEGDSPEGTADTVAPQSSRLSWKPETKNTGKLLSMFVVEMWWVKSLVSVGVSVFASPLVQIIALNSAGYKSQRLPGKYVILSCKPGNNQKDFKTQEVLM